MWETNFRLGVYATEREAAAAADRGSRFARRQLGGVSLSFGTAESPDRPDIRWIAYVTGGNTDVESFKKIWS